MTERGHEPYTLPLKQPLAHGKETISELTFKPVKFKWLKGLPADNIDRTFVLASRMTGVPESVIGEAVGEDIKQIIEVVGDFLWAFQKDGSEPSSP